MIVFITAFLKVYDDQENPKPIEERFKEFLYILYTNIPIHLFISKEFLYLLDTLDNNKKSNLTIHMIELEDTWTYQTYLKYNVDKDISLPSLRTNNKDTEKYILTMNSKLEFIEKILYNCPNYTHYAWIDFNMFHIIKDKELGVEKLKCLNKLNCGGIIVPGCWEKGFRTDIYLISNMINWRFCGGIILGDRDNMEKLCRLNREQFSEFLKKYKKLTWEVNMWAYYEFYHNFEFKWFKGDHDDSIIPVIE
jgi:hypothetical protein